MDIEFAKKFSEDWVESWNAHDIDKIISYYEEKLEFKSPLVVDRYSDPDEIIYDRERLKEHNIDSHSKHVILSMMIFNPSATSM